MALTPFSGNRIFDPFSCDPFPSPFFGSNWALDELRSGIQHLGPSSQLFRDASAVANTQVDWKETPEAHVFTADLPGLKKEEIKVQVEDGRVLSISGERSKEESHKNHTWHRVERSHGRFLRRFRLPENAKVDALNAKVQDGVLTITVPKLPPPPSDAKNKKAVKDIPISG